MASRSGFFPKKEGILPGPRHSPNSSRVARPSLATDRATGRASFLDASMSACAHGYPRLGGCISHARVPVATIGGPKSWPYDSAILTADCRRRTDWLVAQIWVEIHANGYSGATDWGVLREIETAVSDAMYCEPPEIARAESLTFRALHLIAGNIEP